MKLLLDACVWGGTRDELARAEHDVVWVGDRSEDPGDEEVLAHAHLEGRIFVTLDKDFGELAIVHGLPHHGILRLVNLSSAQQGTVCLRALERFGTELAQGAIVTAEPGRFRIRT